MSFSADHTPAPRQFRPGPAQIGANAASKALGRGPGRPPSAKQQGGGFFAGRDVPRGTPRDGGFHDPGQEQAGAEALNAMRIYLGWMHSQALGREAPFGHWLSRTAQHLTLGSRRPYDPWADTPFLPA